MAKKQKYKFVAKPITALEKVTEDDILSGNDFILNNENYTDNNTFDLAVLSISELTKALSKSINKGFKFFLFTQSRENKKINLKIEHVRILQEALNEAKKLGKEILDLKAEAILSTHTLNILVIEKRLNLKNDIEILIEQHKTRLNEEKNKRIESDLRIESIKIDLLLKTAKANEHLGYAKFINAIANDIANLSSGAKMFMWHDLVNRHKEFVDTDSTKDFDFEEFLKKITKDELKEALKRSQAKTTSEQAKADFERHNTDRKTGKI